MPAARIDLTAGGRLREPTEETDEGAALRRGERRENVVLGLIDHPVKALQRGLPGGCELDQGLARVVRIGAAAD